MSSVQPLRPQDILVILKLHILAGEPWTLVQVGATLGLSASGVHGSIQRLCQANLFDAKRREVRGRNVFEFLVHGLKYWIPSTLGPQSQGVPTATSAPPLSEQLSSGASWVWPHIDGEAFGQSVTPFHSAIPDAARRDPALHELLALVETFRIGRLREKRLAEEALKLRLGVK